MSTRIPVTVHYQFRDKGPGYEYMYEKGGDLTLKITARDNISKSLVFKTKDLSSINFQYPETLSVQAAYDLLQKLKTLPGNLFPSTTPSDSDDEFTEPNPPICFVNDGKTPASVENTTISCIDKNIKGSELINIAHVLIQEWYGGSIDLACEYEKDIGGSIIGPPKTTPNGILEINEPKDWFQSFGGWKGLMPNQEVDEYFFRTETSLKASKFSGVSICGGKFFPIQNNRIHIHDKFTIGQTDITGYKKKVDNTWKTFPSGKTDLSYTQIVEAIKTIKDTHKIDDSELAKIQLEFLSNSNTIYSSTTSSSVIYTKLEIFLNYLNALMFGVEASGINAAIVTGLMVLDLIAEGKLSYLGAFKANGSGGFYPFACFGNNQGTFSERETLIENREESEKYVPPSMHNHRTDPTRSPLALKEAVTIKYWLACNLDLTAFAFYDERKEMIKQAIKDIVTFFFAPWVTRTYIIKKFNDSYFAEIRKKGY